MSGYYKIPIPPQKLADDSVFLGEMVVEDGYEPDGIIGIWRCGTLVTSHLTDVFERHEIPHQSFVAKGKSYDKGIDNQTSEIKIYNMEEVVKHLKDIDARKILVGDDVSDTGRTQHAFQHILTNGLKMSDAVERKKSKGGEYFLYTFNMDVKDDKYKLITLLENDITPIDAEIKFAMTYYKPYANLTGYLPDYYTETFDINEKGEKPWLVFQCEMGDLTDEELLKYFPSFYKIVNDKETVRERLKSIKRL